MQLCSYQLASRDSDTNHANKTHTLYKNKTTAMNTWITALATTAFAAAVVRKGPTLQSHPVVFLRISKPPPPRAIHLERQGNVPQTELFTFSPPVKKKESNTGKKTASSFFFWAFRVSCWLCITFAVHVELKQSKTKQNETKRNKTKLSNQLCFLK